MQNYLKQKVEHLHLSVAHCFWQKEVATFVKFQLAKLVIALFI